MAHSFQRTKDRAPPLRMSLNFLSIVFPEHLNRSNHARPNSSSEGLPRNKLPNPPQKHIGGRKTKDGWDKHKHGLQAHTKKTSVTSRQATNNVPAKHQTRSPRDTARSPTTLQTKPNQPEPKKKTPAINDPTAGSPTVTLLRLLLPLNDKVQWTSRDVAGSGPPTSPRSEHFTGPFNR